MGCSPRAAAQASASRIREAFQALFQFSSDPLRAQISPGRVISPGHKASLGPEKELLPAFPARGFQPLPYGPFALSGSSGKPGGITPGRIDLGARLPGMGFQKGKCLLFLYARSEKHGPRATPPGRAPETVLISSLFIFPEILPASPARSRRSFTGPAPSHPFSVFFFLFPAAWLFFSGSLPLLPYAPGWKQDARSACP